MFDIATLDVHVYSVPLRNKFRGITTREGVLFRGAAGWAEFSPFWDYDATESAAWLAAAFEQAHQPLTAPLPGREFINVNVTIPAVSGDMAAALVRASDGCRTAKVKVAEPGQTLADEIERVAAVREALGVGGRVRIDANGLWTLDEALKRLPQLDRAAGGLDYAEQPCMSVTDLAQVRRRCQVPIAADESIRRATDPMLVAQLDAADIVVLKVQPLGGITAALRIAEECGLPAVVSSALETSVGIAHGLQLAARLPQLLGACGLATVQLLSHDVLDSPLLPQAGRIRVPSQSLAPSPELLEQFAAPADRREAWIRRLSEIARLDRTPQGDAE